MSEVEEAIAGLRKQADHCDNLREGVPVDADEMNVRSHVRLRAKAQTYRQAADLVEEALKRDKEKE